MCPDPSVERIAALEAHNESLQHTYGTKLRIAEEESVKMIEGWAKERDGKDALIAELKVENERLKAPVSRTEWALNSFQCEFDHVGKLIAERVDMDDLIAARANPAKPEGEQS